MLLPGCPEPLEYTSLETCLDAAESENPKGLSNRIKALSLTGLPVLKSSFGSGRNKESSGWLITELRRFLGI